MMVKKINSFRELGVSGRAQFGRVQFVETDPALQGINAVRAYDTMRRTDPTGMAMYQVLSLPVRRVTWRCDPGGESAADQAAADFIWSCCNDMSLTWSDFISDVCLMFAYGWAQFWMVLKRRKAGQSEEDDGRVGWRKMELVNHRTLVEWEFDTQSGDIIGPIVTGNQGAPLVVPLKGSLLFRTSREGDAPEGISIYRAARRPYTYKRRLEQIEGMGLQRRWAGFPKVKLPPGASSRDTVEDGEISDEERAEKLVQAIYEDRMMGASLPDGWDLDFGGPQGNVDATMGETIMRKDVEMARAILAQFMLQGLRKVGTNALAGTLFDAFILSVEAYLDSIRAELNRYAIPYLLRWNDFPGMTAPPKLEHSSPRTLDLSDVAAYLRVLSGADLLTPEASLESFLRSLVPGMPSEVDPKLWAQQRSQRKQDQDPEDDAEEQTELDNENEDDDPKEKAQHARFFRLKGAQRTFSYGQKPTVKQRPAAYRALTDANAKAQRDLLTDWTETLAEEIAGQPETVTPGELLDKLDDYVLTALLAFRERSMLDIAAAFWLGFGAPSGPPEALQALQGEIALADSWLGYGPGGTLERSNPLGKPTLFGDIAGQLEGQIAAIVLLLKQGRRDEVGALVTDAVKAATQGYHRAERYSGHVWRAVWVGAHAQREAVGEDGPVRWVMDALAEHCHECPIYAREYPSMAALLRFTGGTLPGYGTECDGNCRCHLEGQGSDGRWGWV